MLNKKIMILAILLVSLFAVSAVSAAEYAVDNTGGIVDIEKYEIADDTEKIIQEECNQSNYLKSYCIQDDEKLSSSPIGTITQLEDKIKNAEDGSVVTLNMDYKNYGRDSLYITKPVIINGNGYTIDGGGASYVFKITSANVTLTNITFINCNGAIKWTGSNGVLNNSKFINNTIPGIVTYYNTLPDFLNLHNEGGALYVEANNMRIYNSEFSNNHVGNAISISANPNYDASVTLSSYGGAIYWRGNDGVLENSIFNNNGVSTYVAFPGNQQISSNCVACGGSVYWLGSGNIINTSFYNNVASAELSRGQDYYNQNVQSYGGAIYRSNVGSNSSIFGCDFNKNEVKKKYSFSSSVSPMYARGSDVYWKGDTGKINYNMIYGSIYTTSKINVDNNWWGSDYNPQYKISGSVCNNWLCCNPIFEDTDDNLTNFYFKLNLLSDGGVLSEKDYSNLPIRDISYSIKGLFEITGNSTTRDGIKFDSLKAAYNPVIVNITIDNHKYSFSKSLPLLFIKNGTYTDLQNKILNCNGLLELTRDYAYDQNYDDDAMLYAFNLNANEGIKINKPLTIIGNNHIIDAMDASRIFNVVSDNVSLNFINIINGTIYWNATNGLIANSILNAKNCIYVDSNAGLRLQDNKEVYDVNDTFVSFVKGEISLSNNMFNNYIDVGDGGIILSDVYVTILDNKTFYNVPGKYNLNATICDDMGNLIKVADFKFKDNYNKYYSGEYVNGIYKSDEFELKNSDSTLFSINTSSKLRNSIIKSGRINSKIIDLKFIINPQTIKYKNSVNVVADLNSFNISGSIKFFLDNIEYETIDIVENKYIVLNNLEIGEHIISAVYSGDSNYESATAFEKIIVNKLDTQIAVHDYNINYGESLIVDVFIADSNATGNVSLMVNNMQYVENIIDGKSSFKLPNINAGNYNFVVRYNGNQYYNKVNTNASIVINKISDFNMNINGYNFVYGNLTVLDISFDKNVTGYVSFDIDGKEYTGNIINGKTTFNLNNLNSGQYAITPLYSGDINYNSKNSIYVFTISKTFSSIDVIVKNNITYGETATVIITTNVDGKAKIKIGTFETTVDVMNHKAIVNIPNLNAKDEGYLVDVLFTPSNINYYNSTETSILKVSKAKPEFNLNIGDVNYNDDLTFNMTFADDITGSAELILFNDKGLELKLLNLALNNGVFYHELRNLDASKYTIKLIYGGDKNYVPTNVSKTFSVFKIDPKISVEVMNATYGETAKVIVNCNAEGNATIVIGSVRTYENVLISNNMIMQDINDIDVGNYSIKLIYNGNNNYNSKIANAKLTITKSFANVVATVEDIDYSQNAIVNVKGSVDGIAIVKIDDNFIKNINILANNVTSVSFDGISVGKHHVSVQLKPLNNNYEECSYNTDFIVSKKETMVALNVEDSVFGDDVVVNVTASEDGKIILKVGDITREKNVFAKTLTKINLGVLAAKTYDVEVSFDAGDNYKSSIDERKIIVSPAETKITDIQANNNIYGENTVIKVKTNVKGILSVKINNIVKTFTIDANKLTSFDLGKYDVNIYDMDLTLDAGANYTQATGNAKVTINPKQTTLSLDANNEVYGNNVVVKVTASENGKVRVQLGNIVKSVDVEANKVASVDFGILNVNSYEVSATFDGGKNFNTSSDRDSFKISPKSSSLTFVNLVNNYVYSNNIVVNVKSDVGGTLTVKIGDKTQTKQITANNIVSFDFGILDVNKYDVIVSLNAGNNYIPSQNTAAITIAPKSTVVTLNAMDYNADEKVVVNVAASENGKVTIKLKNMIKNVDVVANRVTSVDFGFLDIGSYDVVANFAAGNNYIDSRDSANIKVLAKIDKNNINITVPEIKPNQENNIVINLPADATGTVTLTIGDNAYIFNVKNGVADINVPKLDEGNYEYVIKYSGDNKYSSFENTGSIDVAKPDPEIVILPLNEPSQDGSVAISLPNDATGTVTLVIDGKAYSFPVVNGVANVYMPELNDGNYNYSITYSGDGKYSPVTTGGNLNIIAPKIIAKNTAVQYSAKGKYSVTVYGTDGKVSSGVAVIFKISGKQVAKVKTNVNGVASYVVTKNPGKYKIHATALGKSVSKTLTVKHIVTLKTVTLKKSAKKLTLQAALAKVNGKYLKKKTITFKINGKKVATTKTNSKGVAKITIKNPSVVKKLKVGKKVTYQATYLKDTVKKTAKIKK